MRRIWLALPLLMIAMSAASAGAAAPRWPVLQSLAGKVVLLDFWASWCAPCLHSFPWMNELAARYGKDGLVVVAVNLDQDRALADAFLDRVPAAFRVEYDQGGALAREFGVRAMPTSILIDRGGNIRVRHAGFRERERAERERQIRLLLEENAP